MNVNVVLIGGNLTRDIELRYTSAGVAVADFSIANNRKYRGKDEELKEEVSFIGLTSFGKTAENIAKFFKKGSPILVEGRIKTDSWEKDGVKKYSTKVIVDKFQFIGGKKEDNPKNQTTETPGDTFLPEDENWGK